MYYSCREMVIIQKAKLTKAEIIESIKSISPHISRDDIHIVIDSLFDELKGALADGKTIELRGFGTFEVRTRKGKDHARNPKTGAKVSVEDHGVAFFKPGKELQEKVWNLCFLER